MLIFYGNSAQLGGWDPDKEHVVATVTPFSPQLWPSDCWNFGYLLNYIEYKQ